MVAERVAEIVVAGAGIAGIATAYQLAVRAGVRRLILVDPREPLSLTSSKGAEAYRNYWPGPDDTMARFMDRSIDLLEVLDRESGQAFELNRRGYVFLTADAREAERLRGRASATNDFLEGTTAIRARYPFVTERVVAMLHVRRAGYMNAIALGRWLLVRAQESGVEFARDEVTELVIDGQRLAGVRLASGARIDTRAFVLAAGPLLPSWTDRLGLAIPVINERHGKISFEDEAGVIPRDSPMMIWNDAVDLAPLGTFPAGVHLRPRGERSVLGIWTYDRPPEGGSHGVAFPPVFPPVFAHGYPDVVMRGLATMVPGVDRYLDRSVEAIVDGGYYCKAPDNRPLIGPAGIEGAYVLGALSGFGVMASQAAAELVAAHVLAEPLPDYATAFHPARFADPSYQRVVAELGVNSGQL